MRILIVCRAGDDLGLQARQGIVVNDGAERAGDEYLNWGIVNSIGGDRCRTEVRWASLMRLLWISLTKRIAPASLRRRAKCQPTFLSPCTATRTTSNRHGRGAPAWPPLPPSGRPATKEGGLADNCPVLRCGPDIFRDRLGTVEGLDEFCHLRIGTCRLEGQMNVEGSFTQKNLIS